MTTRVEALKIKRRPKGNHKDQMAMGSPRFSGTKQAAMIAGAITPMRPKPIPSIMRVSNSRVKSFTKVPQRLPTKVQQSEIIPSNLGPVFIMIPPAGKAKMIPEIDIAETSQPAASVVMPCTDPKSKSMVGGTLNKFAAKTTPAKITTMATSQGFLCFALFILQLPSLRFLLLHPKATRAMQDYGSSSTHGYMQDCCVFCKTSSVGIVHCSNAITLFSIRLPLCETMAGGHLFV